MSQSDWHREDIKAAVRKTGITMAALSRAKGLPVHACSHALYYPYYWAEVAIAERLGLTPKDIWPSRFLPNGLRRKPPAFVTQNSTGRPQRGQRQKQGAA